MNEIEREKLRVRLLSYPGATQNIVEAELDAHEEREVEKRALLQQRHFSNALAERFLDRKGFPRRPGWHSVFFYPGSFRPRNMAVFWLIVIAVIVWRFAL